MRGSEPDRAAPAPVARAIDGRRPISAASCRRRAAVAPAAGAT